MNIEAIEAFLAIAESQNITKAADYLNLTQSTVSQRLKLLEEELQVSLFVRSKGKRSLELTQKGEEFIHTAERWMRLWKETKAFRNHTLQHLLTVAGVETYNDLLFAPFYRRLAEDQELPIKLDLRTLPSYQIYEGLEKYDFDIGLVTLKRPNKNITLHPLLSEKHYLVGRIETKHLVVDPRELNPQHELIANWGPDFNAWHDYYFDSEIVPWVRTDTSTLAANFLAHKEVWAILPACMISFITRFTDVQVYRLKDPPPPRTCYKALHRHPPANKIQSIRLFEERLEVFLKMNNLHL